MSKRKKTWMTKSLPDRKCPCGGNYVSPSKGKCPGTFSSMGTGRKSWLPGCLDFKKTRTRRASKKFYKWCAKSNGGCGKPFSTADEEILVCEGCASKSLFDRGSIDIHFLISIGFFGFLVGIGIVFVYQVSIFLDCV